MSFSLIGNSVEINEGEYKHRRVSYFGLPKQNSLWEVVSFFEVLRWNGLVCTIGSG